VTEATILTAVTELAKLGTGSLDFWKSLQTTATDQVQKNLVHDPLLKQAPEPGPKG
jgi:hypothetical protein